MAVMVSRGYQLQRERRRIVEQEHVLAMDAFRAAVMFAAHYQCQAPAGWCPDLPASAFTRGWHDAHHAHHVRLRSQGGANDPTNGMALCYAGHMKVHANKAEAAALGLIDRSGRHE